MDKFPGNDLAKMPIFSHHDQAHNRIDLGGGGGGVRDTQKVNLLDPKSGLFEPHPPSPSYKNPSFGPFCS